MGTPTFDTYALVSALLAIHLLLLAGWTGATRTRAKRYLNAEDHVVIKGGAQAPDEDPGVLRVKRAHANALENAVPFFVVGALYVATGGSKLGVQAYCYTFLAARVLHSIFYLAGKQPFRTLSFAVGAFSILGMAVHVIRAALAG